MNFPPYLFPDLPPENVFGHRRKVQCLRCSIDGLRTPQHPFLRILDAGCGNGYAVTRFLPRSGDQVVGIDMHAPSIEFAGRNFGCHELRFECADLSSLPPSEGSYDVVVLADVLEHLDDPFAVLSSAVARLASNGLILISVPNGWGPFEIESLISRTPFLGPALLKLMDLFVVMLDKTVMKRAWSRMANLAPSDLPYNIDSGHVQFFLSSRILKLVNSAGLEVSRQNNLSFLAGPFTNYMLAPSQAFCRWNVRVADNLPRWFASAWYFECRRS